MKICSLHLIEAQWRPAGVSKKTGKPYSGFWSCPQIDNNIYCTAEIIDSDENNEDTTSQEEIDPRPAQKAKEVREILTKTEPSNWDAKDRTSMYQTCINASAEIVTAFVQMGTITTLADAEENTKEMADRFYLKLQEARENGVVPF